jgi:hypothetical protein
VHLHDDDHLSKKTPCASWRAQETVMNNQDPKYVTRARASLMLGIPEAELSRISKESGLGHVERAGGQVDTYFTYEELRRICMVAAHQLQAAH